jgi:hypothetical protein
MVLGNCAKALGPNPNSSIKNNFLKTVNWDSEDIKKALFPTYFKHLFFIVWASGRSSVYEHEQGRADSCHCERQQID